MGGSFLPNLARESGPADDQGWEVGKTDRQTDRQAEGTMDTTHFPNFFFPVVVMLFPGKALRAFFTALSEGEGEGKEGREGRGGGGGEGNE